MLQRLPLSSPDLDGDELRLLEQVLRSGQLSNGEVLAAFEREFAERFGARHALAVSSGTAALHISMILAGVGDGDSVITTPFSFIASANSILYERGTPFFVDIDPETLNIDPDATVAAIESLAPTGRLRAVLPVHIFGRPAEMRPILDAARRHGVPVIEDSCEAVGASADGVYAGRFGDAAVFGFYANKQMTTGEGGMLLTDRDDWAQHARALRNQGRADYGTYLNHECLGYNYRMSDLSAAVGLAQLRRLSELLAKRAAVAARYNELLRDVGGITRPAPPRPHMELSWFVYVIRVDPQDRDRLIDSLAKRGIPARPYFPAIHLQPFYRRRFGFEPGTFPHAEAAAQSLLALPFHARLRDDEIERVCAALAEEVGAAAAK